MASEAEVLRRTRVALAVLVKLIEDGILVRNISGDSDPVKYMRESTTLVLAVKQAQDVLGERP